MEDTCDRLQPMYAQCEHQESEKQDNHSDIYCNAYIKMCAGPVYMGRLQTPS